MRFLKLLRACLIILMLARRLGDAVAKVIIHPDAGSTYIAFDCKMLLREFGFRQSMGETGEVYDDAAITSLNGIIKTECLYNRFGKTRIENHQVSAEEVRPVIEAFMDRYNNERPKEALGWLSPVMFRELNPMGKCPMFIQSGLTDDRS